MPEGDTILRAARTLDRALTGKRITRVESRIPALGSTLGQAITSITAHGKNLLMTFEDGRILHMHMMMMGSWHVYRPGERWFKPAHRARVVLAAGEGDDAFVAVCFSAPVIRLLPRGADARDPNLVRLGPDVLKDDFDRDAARARLRALPERELGDAILAQSAVAGIGNIFKSETLFATRTNPFTKVADVSDAVLDRVLDEAQRLMRKNVLPGVMTRTTSALPSRSGRYAVYKRSGSPCPVCGAIIEMRRQGVARRSTYYCPACQAVGESQAKTTLPVRSALDVGRTTPRRR